MAHRLFRPNPSRMKEAKDLVQCFKYLLVLDFEATCEKDKKIIPQELIELPCLALSTSTWEVKDVFHEYIKPRVNPMLTSYCTDLTGIIQEMIDDQQYFSDTFTRFQKWLDAGGYFQDNNNAAFVTCGDWDLRVMLREQCRLDNIDVPNYFDNWIDLKKSFYDATLYYPKSLKDMLIRLKLPIQGRLHSGIDDVYNMTRIIQMLGSRGKVNFEITSRFNDKKLHK